MKASNIVIQSNSVTGRLDQLLSGESKIMSRKLKTLLEGLRSELEQRSVRKNVKILTLIKR